MEKIKVVHVINSLELGGAEMMLYRLVGGYDKDRFEMRVLSLMGGGPVGELIAAEGVKIEYLGGKRGVADPRLVFRLAAALRRAGPQVIQAWMYHSNLAASLASAMAGKVPVVWGIHHSNLDPGVNKKSTIAIANFCGRIAQAMATEIVCCSQASFKVHAEHGYPKAKMQVITNGFDLGLFKPDPMARLDVRRELGVGEDTRLVGLVARFDPLKDHRNFLEAAARIVQEVPGTHFLLCGTGISTDNAELVSWIDELRLKESCSLLGRRSDIPRLLSSLDVAVSSSMGEGFPISVGEAMSCAIPSVVTDVGDSAAMVADTGYAVPARDPEALASACVAMLRLSFQERCELGMKARQRVVENYSLGKIIQQYEEVYACAAERIIK